MFGKKETVEKKKFDEEAQRALAALGGTRCFKAKTEHGVFYVQADFYVWDNPSSHVHFYKDETQVDMSRPAARMIVATIPGPSVYVAEAGRIWDGSD